MSRQTVDLSARLDEPTENGNPAEFPVATRPVFYGDSYRVHRVPNRRAVVREDTGRPLAVVSDQYTLVEHGRLLESVEHAIEQLELDGVPRGIYVDREGARMRALYKFPQLARPVHRDDPICPCVKLQNSYDRSLRAAVHIGAFRFVCTNLAVGGGGVFAGGFVTLHRGEIPVEKVTDQLAAYLDGFDEIARVYRHWAETRLDWERLTELLEPLAQHVQEGITERVRPAFGATVYEAYNAATRYATHEMSSYQSAFRLLKQINREFQNQFSVPSSNPSTQQARDGDVPGSSFVERLRHKTSDELESVTPSRVQLSVFAVFPAVDSTAFSHASHSEIPIPSERIPSNFLNFSPTLKYRRHFLQIAIFTDFIIVNMIPRRLHFQPATDTTTCQ